MIKEFDRLAKDWIKKTKHHSNPWIIMEHESCRAIVAMGKEVIPYCLLNLLHQKSMSWCWLLQEISGENPTSDLVTEKIGSFIAYDVNAVVDSWLNWGRERYKNE